MGYHIRVEVSRSDGVTYLGDVTSRTGTRYDMKQHSSLPRNVSGFALVQKRIKVTGAYALLTL